MIAALIMAGVGLIVNLIGRWLVIQEDQSQRKAARWALILVPGAELVYMLFRWEKAKAGSIVCALSFALTLPVAGQISLIAKRGQGPSWEEGWAQLVGGKAGEQKHAQAVAGRERAIILKREKLTELQAYLSQWHGMLEQRRGMLSDDLADETRIFNRDAAAYHGLLSASKVELSELEELTKRQTN